MGCRRWSRKSVPPIGRELGATNLDLVLLWAASGGHESIVRLCRDWSAHDNDWAMHGVRISIVRLCRDLVAIEVDQAMVCAANSDQESILCHD